MSINPHPLFYQQTNADGTTVLRSVSDPIPLHDMPLVPGKLYVRKLPGRKRPEWVRKRVPSAHSPFGFTAIAEAFGGPYAPSCSTDDSVKEIRTYSTAPNLDPFLPQPLHVQPGQTVTVTQDPVYTQQAPPIVKVSPGLKTTVITETGGQGEKHTCASCGKYRSGSYQLRHPLRPGEMPKGRMCRKCAKEETSSEDSDNRKHRGHKKKHYRQSTESESSSDRERSRRYRRRSVSRHRSRKSARSSSVDRIRITIVKTTDEPRSRLAARRRRSPEPIRIVRHIYINRTEPESRRDSSDRHTRGRSERVYDIDRPYISDREPSPRYRETEYLRGYDTVRERPLRRSDSLLARRGTPHQGYYERPSVSHVRDVDDYDSAYESGGSVEIDPRSSRRVIQISPEAEPRPRSRSRSVRAVRHISDEPRPRSRSRSVRAFRHISDEPRSRSRSRSVRAFRHISDEPRPRSRSRSVRAFRHISDEPRSRSRSRSVRYFRVSQAPDRYESAEAEPRRVFLQSRARSPTPIRHRRFTETLESPRSLGRHRDREGIEFQARSSEEVDSLESPVSSEHFARAVNISRPVSLVRTRYPTTDSDHTDYPISRSSIPGVSYVRGRDSRSRHSRSESYRPERSRRASMAGVQFGETRYMDPAEREAYVGHGEEYRERARRSREW